MYSSTPTAFARVRCFSAVRDVTMITGRSRVAALARICVVSSNPFIRGISRSATTTDATNLYIVLTARGLNPRLKIIARASEDDAEKHLLTAGADSVVSPYHFAGQRIAQSFLRPHVVSFLDTATTHLGMDLEIGEICVTPDSSFAGKTIENSRIRQDRGVIILAIKREEGMRFNPSPEDRIQPGDYLIAMGEPGQLRQLEQMASHA